MKGKLFFRFVATLAGMFAVIAMYAVRVDVAGGQTADRCAVAKECVEVLRKAGNVINSPEVALCVVVLKGLEQENVRCDEESPAATPAITRNASRDNECQRSYSGARFRGMRYGWFQYYTKENILGADGKITHVIDKGCQPITCPSGSRRDSVQAVCMCESNTENAGRPIEGDGSEAVGKLKPGIGSSRSVLLCNPSRKSQQTEKPTARQSSASSDEVVLPNRETRCGPVRRAITAFKSSVLGAANNCDAEEVDDSDCAVHEWKRPDGSCRPSVTYRVNLDVESAEDVEQVVDALPTNGQRMIVVTLQNGATVRLGMMKLGSGQIMFTKDGEYFYSNLAHTIHPSFMRRTFRGIGNALGWLNVFEQVHAPLTDKYAGEGADRESKWQAARGVLKDFEQTLEKEKELAEYLNDIREKLADHKENLEEIEAILRAGGESDDVIRVLADMGQDEIKGFLKDKLISFPAETIKALYEQLNIDDFAEGVRVYIGQREIKYTPEQIFDDPPADLTFSGMVSREYDLGKRLLFIKYEEAYQRYLLSKEFGN